MSEEVEAVVVGVALPFAIGAGAAAFASRRDGLAWLWAVALALGYLPMHAVLFGWPHQPRYTGAEAWFGWLVPIAAAIGALGRARPTLAVAQRAALLAAVLVALVLPSILRGAWKGGASDAVRLGAVAIGLALLARGAERNARRDGAALALGLVTVSAIAGAVVSALAGGARVGQALGAFAATAGGMAVVAMFVQASGGRTTLASSTGPVVTVAFGGLLAAAALFGELHWYETLLVALPFLLGGLVPPGALGERSEPGWGGVGRDLMRLGFLAVPLALAVLLASLRYEPSPY